jgi:hypothetical protein
MWSISTIWVVTNYATCIREIKARASTTKATFNKKKTLFASKLDLNLRNKLVKGYIWNTALYGAETWVFRKVEQKSVERFPMWCWRRMKKIIWNGHVRNEEVLQRSKSRVITYKQHKEGKLTELVTSCLRSL